MGAERMAPGKATLAQAASADATSAVASPGKATQVDRLYGQSTGNAGIDNGGKGSEKVTGDNFLKDTERGVLIAEYIGRVNAALASYLTALTDLRVDKLTEKEEEFPILGALLIAAGGKGAESVIMGACTLLRRGGEAVRQLAEAGVHVSESVAGPKILGMSERSVEFIVGTATDQAKDKLKGSAAKAIGAVQTEEKGAALSFIDYMRDAAMTLYQRFREWPIGRADDAQLLALFTSFEGSRHTPTMYRRLCEEHVKLYMQSHAKDIGHKEEFGAKNGKMAETRTETRVAYIRNGSTVTLGYVGEEYVNDHGGGVPGSAAVDAPDNAIGLSEAGVETEGPKFLGYVEPELHDVALATHEQRWLQAPAMYTINYPSMALTRSAP